MDSADWKGMPLDSKFTNALMRQAILSIEEVMGRLTFSDHAWAICHTRQSDRPLCHLYLGSLEESLKWATGKDIPVEEVACRARGEDLFCRFVAGESAE